MQLFDFIKARRWTTAFGYVLFIGMMAVGYYYNITFVQLGLIDLGTRVIGMSRQSVAGNMAVLALLTCAVALGVGVLMQWRGWNARFKLKLRLAFGVVLTQTLLTAIAPFIRSETGFLAWIVVCAAALGVGVPATFSMTADLIPRRDRGYAAALITAGAYFAGAVLSAEWSIEWFSLQMLLVMVPGVLGMGVFAFRRFDFIEKLAQQHEEPAFRYGRFVRVTRDGRASVSRRLLILLFLMFGVYFVDSLGFLRIVETPALVETTWQSPEMSIHLAIGIMHLVTALIAGVLYSSLGERGLFLWIFGIFALVHVMYGMHIRTASPNAEPLAESLLYAAAVSLYTVINFALWADVSTIRNISFNAAVGVALSAWSATFLSTALALQWQLNGMPLERHLNIVDALAILFFLVAAVVIFMPKRGNIIHET